MRPLGLPLFLSAAFGSQILMLSAAGQATVPYSANYSETYTEKGVTTTHPHEGKIERTSDGSVLTVNFKPGTSEEDTRSLYEGQSGLLYTIRKDNHTAVGVKQKISPVTTPKAAPLGHEIVSGIPTTLYPIYSGASKSIVGTIWIADGCGFIVRVHSESGRFVHDYLLTKVVLHSEPDRANFSIPSGYDVSRPQN